VHPPRTFRRSNRLAFPGGVGGPGDRPGSSAPAAAPVAAEKPAPKGDRLDDLLDTAMGNKARPATRARDDEEPAKKPAASLGALTREDMVRAMQGVAARVRECYTQYKVPGTAMVKTNVARGGRVSSVAVSGKFAGTPTGSCVETAVRGAHFPPVEAGSFDYPFPLR
jgi:hypothetical protein